MKVKATISWEYEVPDDKLMESYGTADPEEAVAIDLGQFNQLLFDEYIPDNAVLKLERIKQ